MSSDDNEQRKDLADELANFQEIASHFRPSSGALPELAGIEICGLSLPLHGEVGGDHVIYIDFKKRYNLQPRIERAEREGRTEILANLRKLEHRAGVLLADVAGHRTTDAFIAAMLHQAFLLGVHYELDIFGEITTRIFEHLNTRFYRTTSFNKYFSMIYGEITEEGNFRFISAGHPPPVVFSREYGRFVKISEDRLVTFQPVGMLPSIADEDASVAESTLDVFKKEYRINEISLLAPGDTLLLYTDGLSEHGKGDYFPGEVERLLREGRDASAAEICARLKRDLLRHAPLSDDVTVIAIRKTGV
jgi:serine phosphatase RsbU (regulator of sigma subunit)